MLTPRILRVHRIRSEVVVNSAAGMERFAAEIKIFTAAIEFFTAGVGTG
jgi:hypothetical protein